MNALVIPLQTGTLAVSGEDLYYELAGSGACVVLCHGAGGNHASWYQQVPELAHHYRTLTWDERGFGRSTNRSGGAGRRTSIADLGALLDHCGVDRAHVVGHSLGGWVALGLAISHPERVRSLVLTDTVAGIFTADIEAGFDAYLDSAATTAPAPAAVGQTTALGAASIAKNPVRAFLYQQISSLAPPPPPSTIPNLRRTSFELDAVARTTVPVLFLVGTDDPIFTPAMVHAAAAVLSQAETIEIPAAGHSAYFEQPERWNALVLNFLANVEAGTARLR